MDAEAVLLIDDRQGQVMKRDVLLDEGMRTDGQRQPSHGQVIQQGCAFSALVASGQQADVDADGTRHGRNRREMLARQDFGRRQQGGLRSRLDGGQHGHERNDRLAAADIALQQPQHPGGLAHIRRYLGDRLALCAGQREGQGRFRGGAQPSVAADRAAGPVAEGRPHQGQGELVGEQLVIRQPRAGGARR